MLNNVFKTHSQTLRASYPSSLHGELMNEEFRQTFEQDFPLMIPSNDVRFL